MKTFIFSNLHLGLMLGLTIGLTGCLEGEKSGSIPMPNSERKGASYQESRPHDNELGYNKVDANSPAIENAGYPPISQGAADAAYQITAMVTSGCKVNRHMEAKFRNNKKYWGAKDGARFTQLEALTFNNKDGQGGYGLRRAKWNNTVVSVAGMHGMDPNIIHALISTESGYVERITGPGTFSGAAKGMMQLIPGTGKMYGLITTEDFFNGHKNINAGTQYFKYVLKRFNNNISLAIAGYNAGPGTIGWCGGNIPPFKETMNYTRKVTGLANLYRANRL